MRSLLTRRKWPWLSVFLLLLVPACTPKSKHPLSDLDKAEADTRLFGQWQSKQEGYTLNWFIGKPSRKELPPGLMVLLVVRVDKDGTVSGGLDAMYFFPTTLGKDHYANVLGGDATDEVKYPKWDKAKIEYYHFGKYAVEGNKLTVWIMSDEAATAAIKKGQLKGTIEGSNFSKTVSLTDPSEVLGRFLTDGGKAALFPEKPQLELEKVK